MKARAAEFRRRRAAFRQHGALRQQTLIAQHPDLVRRFLKAWYENIAWANAHKKETVDLLVPILNLKPDTVAQIYDRLMPTQSTDGRFDPEGDEDDAERDRSVGNSG